MVESPRRTDAETADIYGMNVSTVASVRRRMLDAGAVYFVNVPSFHKLGCEMVAFHKGLLDPAVSNEVKTSNYIGFCATSPEIFDAIIGAQSMVFMSVLESSAALDELMLRHSRFFSGTKKASKATISTTVFPYGASKGTYAPNFGPVVHRFFGLDTRKPRPRLPAMVEATALDLRENEQRVLMALVEHPSAPDRELASIVGLSRQAVTRIRHKLQDENYYTFICVPRLYRWGFEIFSSVHVRFASDFAWSSRYNKQPTEPIDYSFFTLQKADEAIANHMIATFKEYTLGMETGLAWYHREKAFEKEPDVTLMSLEHCVEIKTFEFASALRNLLDKGGRRRLPHRRNV